jgi:hypothetical protein
MKRCFVISPIGQDGSDIRKHADYVFYFIIKPALDEHRIEAIRSDHLNEPGKISDQMFREILNDDLCIAVLTGRNPNVYYELAVAQSATRPVILLIQAGEELPFDIQDLRTVTYDLDPKRLFEQTYAKMVSEYIRSLEATQWRVSSPIGNAAQILSLNYSLYLGAPPKVKSINVQSLMGKIAWDSDNCFLVSGALREKIALRPSIGGPTFEVEIPRELVERVKSQPVELDLKDTLGNVWKVKTFYLFRSLQPLSLGESPDKIESDYGDEEEE